MQHTPRPLGQVDGCTASTNRKVYSHTPYGFERQGDVLIPLPAEQVIVGRIRLMHASGYSLRKIAAALNADAMPTKQGRHWPQTATLALP